VSDFNFKPIDCKRCGHLVWDGLTAGGIPMKLDMARLTMTEELVALTSGTATYQVHRTALSFEATRRTATRMKVAEPIVLATHTCRAMTVFAETAPDYWNRVKLSTTSEKVPF